MSALEFELKLALKHLEQLEREYHAAQDQVSALRRQIIRETGKEPAVDGNEAANDK